MGGMMGTQGSSAVLWSLLVLALVIAALAGTALALARSRRHRGSPPQIPSGTSPGLQEARDALRLRYARGEISREDYLQGKVELED